MLNITKAMAAGQTGRKCQPDNRYSAALGSPRVDQMSEGLHYGRPHANEDSTRVL